MKILRKVMVIAFAAVLAVFCLFFLNDKINSDSTIPSIQVESDVLEISIHDGEDKLLEGVTAFDKKDGDISDKVIVESISQFSDDQVCTVTYAVADADKHVARNTRQIHYKDYTPPQFVMKGSPVLTIGTELDIHEIVGAVDCIDGDISDKVIIASANYQTNSVGVYNLTLQASNSMGDVIYLELPIYVEDQNLRAPVIELTENLIYVKKGERPDFASYISSVKSFYNSIDEGGILISESFNPNVPGVYTIHYYALDSIGNEGHAILTVIVEE